MQKPDTSTEKEFNANGIYFLDHMRLSDPTYEGSYVGVEVEIGLPLESSAALKAPDFAVSIQNRRKVAILITDWSLTERDGMRVLSFRASQRHPDSESLHLYPNCDLAMTFQDLCFYAGNEAIPEGYAVDTYTKQRAGTRLSDLGWHLPSRYVDSLIDAIGKLNDTMLGGMIDNAILYGIVTKSV